MFLSENGVNENFIVLNVSFFFFSPEAIVKEDDLKPKELFGFFSYFLIFPFTFFLTFFFIR